MLASQNDIIYAQTELEAAVGGKIIVPGRKSEQLQTHLNYFPSTG